MNTGFLWRMHRNVLFLPTVELKEQLPIAWGTILSPSFWNSSLKRSSYLHAPSSLPAVSSPEVAKAPKHRGGGISDSFCLGRNGCKGEKDGRGPGWLNKHVGVRSRERHWKCWVTWGTQIAECAFLPETVSGQMSHPSWEGLQYNEASCLFLH